MAPTSSGPNAANRNSTRLCAHVMSQLSVKFRFSGVDCHQPRLKQAVAQNDYDCGILDLSCESFCLMNPRISSPISSNRSHCSLYKVTGNRPSPYTETAPFSLTLKDNPFEEDFLRASFSARSFSSSVFRSSSPIVVSSLPRLSLKAWGYSQAAKTATNPP
jgi:hypothetical protein